MRKNKIVVVLLLALVFALSVVFAACQLTPDEPTQHTCTSKCPDCGKCTNATCTEDACKEKCPGHHCKHVCPDCGGCLDDTCTNPICANNRCICESLIDSAKNYIDGLYKKDEVYATDRDYELVTSAYIKKTDVTIAWSIEVAEGTTAPAKIEVVNGKTMVVISTEEATVARPYTLVGVITAGKDTVTVRYERTVPVIDANLNAFLNDAVTSVTAGKQYVLGLYQKKLGKAFYFTGKPSGNYLATTEDIESAMPVTLVAVEGGYRLQFQDGETTKYIEVYVYDAASGKTGVGLFENGSDKMLSPASVWTFDKDLRTLFTTVAEVKYYIGSYNEFNTISRSEAKYLTASNVDVSQFPIRLIEKKAEVERNDQEKADYEISKLSIDTEIYTAGTVDLPATGAKYTDVAITWTSDNDKLAAIADGKVTYKLPTAQTTVKLTATATINGKTASKTFDVVVKPLSPITVAEFLAKEKGDTVYLIEGWVVAAEGNHETAGSFVLADQTGSVFSYEKFKVAIGDKIRVYATRTVNSELPQLGTTSVEQVTLGDGEKMPEFAATEWDATQIDMSKFADNASIVAKAGTYYKVTGATLKTSGDRYLEAAVNDTIILRCYYSAEIKAIAATLVGKEVVLYGYVRGGNPSKFITLELSKVEAAGGGEIETPDVQKEADKLADITIDKIGETTLPTSTTVTITWAVADGSEVKGATFADGKITVAELPTDADITFQLKATVTVEGSEAKGEKTITVTIKKAAAPVDPDKGTTAEKAYTPGEANALEIESGKYTDSKVYVKGIVKSFESGSYAGKLYLTNIDGTEEFLVYSCSYTDTIKSGDVSVGDTVVCYGYITNYNGTIEMAGKSGDYPTFYSVVRGEGTLTVATNDKATVVVKDGIESATNGTTFTFTVTAAEGYKIVSVKVNGTVVEAVDGVYTSKIDGKTTIVVETAEEGAAELKSVVLDFTAQGYTNAQEVTSLTVGDATATFGKGTNNNAPKYYTSGNAVRVYGSNTVTISSEKSIAKIVITFGKSDGSNEITADVGTFATNTWLGSATSVTLTVGGTSGNRRIAKIEVFVEA